MRFLMNTYQNAIQIYTETLRNISVVAKSAANNIRQFIDKHDCEQLAPLFDLCSVLEELLPYLHKRTGEYCTRATRIEYVHKTYHVDLNVEFDRYCLDCMTEEDNADASTVERKADPFFFEITEIMASLKCFSDRVEALDSFERKLYPKLAMLSAEERNASGANQLLEILTQPFFYRKSTATCLKLVTKARILWRDYLFNHALYEGRRQREILNVVRILKKFLSVIAEENSNFLQCAKNANEVPDKSVTRVKTYVSMLKNYRKMEQLEVWNILYFLHPEDPIGKYIIENGLEKAWLSTSELFLSELDGYYEEDNLWIISDDLRKIAYLLTLSYRCQSRIDCYEFYMRNLGKSPAPPDCFDKYLTAAVKILMVAKLIQDSISAYSFRADCPDFLKKNDDINIIDTLPDSITKLDPDEWNDFEEIGQFTTFLIDVLCLSNGSFRSSIDTAFGLFPYSEEKVIRNTDDVFLLCSILEYISKKMLDCSRYPFFSEDYWPLAETLQQIGQELEAITSAVAEEVDALYHTIGSAILNLHPSEDGFWKVFLCDYPFSEESLSWRHGEKFRPLPLDEISFLYGLGAASYELASFCKYGGSIERYNSRHMMISYHSCSGGWV